MEKNNNMDLQTWTITFQNDSKVETIREVNDLKEILLDAFPQIKMTLTGNQQDTQSGFWDTIIALLPSTTMIAVIKAFENFMLRNHGSASSIELEIEDKDKKMKFKATGISIINYKYTMDELAKIYAQWQKDETPE